MFKHDLYLDILEPTTNTLGISSKLGGRASFVWLFSDLSKFIHYLRAQIISSCLRIMFLAITASVPFKMEGVGNGSMGTTYWVPG